MNSVTSAVIPEVKLVLSVPLSSGEIFARNGRFSKKVAKKRLIIEPSAAPTDAKATFRLIEGLVVTKDGDGC